MFFRELYFENFPPFADQLISFPEVEKSDGALAETHAITGINGTGKTRLLSVLAAALGNDEHIAKRWSKPEGCVYVNDAAQKHDAYRNEGGILGTLFIADGIRMAREDQKPFADKFAFAYNGTAYVEDADIKAMESTKAPDAKTRLSFARPPEQSSMLLQNLAILKYRAAMEIIGARKTSAAIPDLLVDKLEKAISCITGKDFEFEMDRYPAISVRWGDEKKLNLALLPDGLRSIIGWLVNAGVMLDACLEGKSDPTEYPAIFLLDEPESHLHPAWQRKIIPAFQKLFPKAQIFVATHSPFVISSVNHGWIHCLDNSDGKVKVKSEPAKLGDSYMSVVEDLMGLTPRQAFDTESEALLTEFYAARDAARNNESGAFEKAEKIALEINSRGGELEFIAGSEIAQLRHQLSSAKAEG